MKLGNGNNDWPRGPFHWLEGQTLNVSIPFTWNLPEVREMLLHRHIDWNQAIVGGPAVALMPDFFSDLDFVTIGTEATGILQRINPLATRTTLGCTKTCKFCGIGTGKIEGGGLVELHDWPDLPILCDNNLLAASQRHFDRVCDRLEVHGWADFNQGLDARKLSEYHAERIERIGRPIVRLACDHSGMYDEWEDAFTNLRRAGVVKSLIRSYALIGFNAGPDEAWERCRWIESHGVKVNPMWYHPLDAMEYNGITKEQAELGWSQDERGNLMMFYYQHIDRGARKARRFYDPNQYALAGL